MEFGTQLEEYVMEDFQEGDIVRLKGQMEPWMTAKCCD